MVPSIAGLDFRGNPKQCVEIVSTLADWSIWLEAAHYPLTHTKRHEKKTLAVCFGFFV